ncbi:MAG: DUF1592 domain-containing protein [Rubinisphaera brasiliensis]|uniref:DUF1592 domain-containing protein n=1 Tax=Rubinisphaera brasiliensis TaxID=119 RepID=UPI00391A01FA
MTPLRVQNLLPLLIALLLPALAVADDIKPHPGLAVYRAQCVDCHGERGEGVEGVYPQPLIGDLSIKELSSYISGAMPEGAPEECVGQDAEAVAEYIHQEFYSIIARVRNQPPEIDMARLTVRQYRNSLADLAGSFSWQGNWDEKRGLDADYYKTRRRSNENRVIERVDPVVKFDFGEGSPSEEIPAEEFTINWRGGLLAPETGVYDIILETENAGELWLNDTRVPLIDARVKSGDQTTYRESIFLLGGRVYPIRIDYTKSKNETKSSVSLRWKRPHGVDETIATHYLSPNNFNQTLVIETDFPPDDKSVGYERGVSVSKEWNDATTYGAIEFADKLMPEISKLAKLPKEEDQHAEKLKEFCRTLATRAFRRPLTPELEELYIERQFRDAESPMVATKRAILLTLKSPRFLFPGAAAEKFDDYRVASWLALALWDSIPDQNLLNAAGKNQLNTESQIRGQADRMVKDLRAKGKMQAFFAQWLNLGHFEELSKSDAVYPEFDKAIVNDLRTSLELFVDDVVWSDSSDYRQLLLSDTAYLNGRLAEFYGVKEHEGETFERVSFQPEIRAGLVSHPFLLAGLAYEDTSSPIHRGVFVARSLLGRFLKPPPIAVAPVPADLKPDMTTRERVAEQTSSTMCAACHGMINPLGFALENFDAVGRFREQEKGKAVNSSGIYIDREGNDNEFQGARGLAEFLVDSPEAHSAFTEQLFQYLTKQPIQAFGPDLHEQLQTQFVKENFHIRRLLTNTAVKSVLAARTLRETSEK